jgi:hypothetical protein
VYESVKYISKIPEVEGAVSAALLALGDGNWKIGEGAQVGQKSKGCDGLEEGSENVVLEPFIRKSMFSFFPSRLPRSAPLCLSPLLIPTAYSKVLTHGQFTLQTTSSKLL